MTRMTDRAAWTTLIGALGTEVRTLRRLLGVSQQQLAHAAGITQGAVSRLEMGTHLEVPLRSVISVVGVLATLLAHCDGAVPPPMSALFTVARDLPTAFTTPLTPPDPELAQLLGAYHALSASGRAVVRTICRPLLTHLATLPSLPTATDESPPVTEP